MSGKSPPAKVGTRGMGRISELDSQIEGMLLSGLLTKTERADSSDILPDEEPHMGDALPSDRGHYSLLQRCHLLTRLLDRNASFWQSGGKWAVRNFAHHKRSVLERMKFGEDLKKSVNRLFMEDFFHVILHSKLEIQLLIVAMSYILVFAFFALAYLVIEKPCGLNLDKHFLKAYMLSIETHITIGYGVPDPYMNGCWQAPVVWTVQTLLSLLMSSLLVGVVYQRLSRPTSRATTIIFSRKAVIRELDGVHYFMFRLYDLRVQHALIEAHVRCYAVRHHSVRGYEMVQMRLEQPDDDVGAPLLLTLPSLIVHRIDAWSPLAPPPKARAPPGDEGCALDAPSRRREQLFLRSPGWPCAAQRYGDCETGNRDSCVCPFCGESFNTPIMLQLHCRYNAESDRKSDLDPAIAHKELSMKDARAFVHEHPTRTELQTHLEKYFTEVIVLLEGIDPTTSNTLQARYSYVVGGSGEIQDDVAWDMGFKSCCQRCDESGLIVDLARFHELEAHQPEEQV